MILEEITNIGDLFGDHYAGNPKYTGSALKDGKSVWLHSPNPETDFLLKDRTPFIISFLKSVSENIGLTTFGRAYIYNLGPGLEIFKHSDTLKYYHITRRYHVYLNIPKDVIIEHSGPPIQSNTIIPFNPLLDHAYKNMSNESLIFIVFDLYQNE
jgi:hypothetical protein